MDLGIVWGLFGGPLGVCLGDFRGNICPIFSYISTTTTTTTTTTTDSICHGRCEHYGGASAASSSEPHRSIDWPIIN